MTDRKVAYEAVALLEGRYGIAIVEADIAGYAMDPTESEFDSWSAASARARTKNESINVNPRQAWETITSSMRKSVEAHTKWGPRGS